MMEKEPRISSGSETPIKLESKEQNIDVALKWIGSLTDDPSNTIALLKMKIKVGKLTASFVQDYYNRLYGSRNPIEKKRGPIDMLDVIMKQYNDFSSREKMGESKSKESDKQSRSRTTDAVDRSHDDLGSQAGLI